MGDSRLTFHISSAPAPLPRRSTLEPMPHWIAISLGDVTGMGAEVTLKALVAELGTDDTRYLLIGDEEHTRRLNQQLGLELPLESLSGKSDAGCVFLFQPGSQSLPADLAPGSPEAARAAVAWLAEGAKRCLTARPSALDPRPRSIDEGPKIAALVTAPVNKESILRSGISFVGQTTFLSQLAGAERTAMMLLGQDARGRWLRVVLATTHIPLKLVPERLTRAKTELAIE